MAKLIGREPIFRGAATVDASTATTCLTERMLDYVSTSCLAADPAANQNKFCVKYMDDRELTSFYAWIMGHVVFRT
jgi:hypothetical protein